MGPCSPESCPDRMPNLLRGSALECRFSVVNAEVIQVDVSAYRSGQGPDGIHPPKHRCMAWRVVKNVHVIQDRPGRESVHVPGRRVQDQIDAVKCLPDVWSFSYIYKTSG